MPGGCGAIFLDFRDRGTFNGWQGLEKDRCSTVFVLGMSAEVSACGSGICSVYYIFLRYSVWFAFVWLKFSSFSDLVYIYIYIYLHIYIFIYLYTRWFRNLYLFYINIYIPYWTLRSAKVYLYKYRFHHSMVGEAWRSPISGPSTCSTQGQAFASLNFCHECSYSNSLWSFRVGVRHFQCSQFIDVWFGDK